MNKRIIATDEYGEHSYVCCQHCFPTIHRVWMTSVYAHTVRVIECMAKCGCFSGRCKG